MISIDLHVDTLMAITHEGRHLEFDAEPGPSGLPPRQLDLPKMQAGGLDAAVFSIFVTPYWQASRASERALALIAALRADLARPEVADGIELVHTVDALTRAAATGRRGAFIGIEGGHAISGSIERLRELAALGARYMTLTWSNANEIGDSSGSPALHGGLTAFGRDVVREMERLGVLVDISHVADTTATDTLDLASAPVIASHSGCRAIHAHPRNLTDEHLRALAASGGVVGIPVHSEFLEPTRPGGPWHAPWRSGEPVDDPATMELSDRRARPRLLPAIASLASVIRHVLHALEVAGPQHVALGTDYDGLIVPPAELNDVSQLPVLRNALAAAGVDQATLDAMWGGNALRVLRAAEGAPGWTGG